MSFTTQRTSSRCELKVAAAVASDCVSAMPACAAFSAPQSFPNYNVKILRAHNYRYSTCKTWFSLSGTSVATHDCVIAESVKALDHWLLLVGQEACKHRALYQNLQGKFHLEYQSVNWSAVLYYSLTIVKYAYKVQSTCVLNTSACSAPFNDTTQSIMSAVFKYINL